MKIFLRDKLTGLYLSRAGESPNHEDAVVFRGTKQAVDFCVFHHLKQFELVARFGLNSECEFVICESCET